MTRSSWRKAWSIGLLGLVLGCSRGGDDVREWTPGDHDHTGSPSAGQVDASQPGALSPHGVSDVVLATWKQNCVTCHGVVGRGDGPQGRMLKPPDFTHPVWQKNALDDNMRRSILKGRGAMPAFGHLPESTVDGLVQLIRLLNRERSAAPTEGSPASQPGSAPAGSAPAGSAPAGSAPAGSAPPSDHP